MKTISFYKMEASGNDFVIVDNRSGAVKAPPKFARKICRRHTGVGADGVLLFEKSRRADFKMRVINADGSEAEACGNGFRCIAKYAHEKNGLPARFRFESLSGLIEARLRGKKIKVRLIRPKGLRQDGEIDVLGHRLHYSFLDTGVPHVVLFVEGLGGIDVEGIGRAVRQHPCFRPKGTNVNFVEIKGPRAIEVRTYERGVEAETQACGTGSTAAAAVSCLFGYTRPPVRVTTKGSEVLTIDFKIDGKKIREAYLEGEARFVFEGKVTV